MEFVRTTFAGKGLRALLWAAMGALGLAFAAIGVALMTGAGGDDANTNARVQAGNPGASSSPGAGQGSGQGTGGGSAASASAVASPTPTTAASETPTATVTATATATPRVLTTSSQGQNQGATPTPEPPAPTPEPTTAPPVAAAPGGPYCDTRSASSPPTARVAGALVLGGQAAPAGTTVSLAFDGVVGPSRATTAAGEYRVDFNTGGADCANRVGAAISVVVNGAVYGTGHTIGDGALLIGLSITN